MTLKQLVSQAKDKTNFTTLEAYTAFALKYLEFAKAGLQATIVSQNENHYLFWQYRKDGHFNISRPINSQLMYGPAEAGVLEKDFPRLLKKCRDIPKSDAASREKLVRSIYTIQQAIGAALDALPAGDSNRARKLNGDLFERLIQLVIIRLGLDCRSGTVQVPVVVKGERLFDMSYQHDLLLYRKDQLRAIGSVKTSSKDRLDKIFLDKFLYCKLTDTELPHIAVFLNDVQRKQTKKHNKYGISATFLPGHFKGYSIKLNALDGVYYCDLRPNMTTDPLLRKHISPIDQLLCSDIWRFVGP